MKKLLLLLALSFFSIQGFAAGCPDGSEPVKSISADGTYFVFDCKNIASLNSDNSNKKYFEVLNLKTIDDKYFTEIFDYATSKIKYIPADQNTLAIFIPVGRWLTTCNTESSFFGCGNNIYEVILTNAQIDNAFRVIDDFQKQENCWDENSIRQVERLKFEISKGVSKGYAADLCRNSKLILLSFGSSDDALLTEHIFHEAYHTFQNNTDMCNSWDMPNYRFLTEGAAEYFRYYYMLERKNSLDEFENFILYEVSKNPYPDGFTALGEGESKYTQYMPGLASIALMIDQGWATQSSILDASFFSDCSGVRQLLLGSDKLKYLNDNWFKIELHNGNLRFNPLLSDDEVRVQNSFFRDLAIASSKKLPDNSKFSRNRYGFKCNSGFKREGNNMCTKDLAIAQKIAKAIKTSEKSKSTSKEVSTLETNESVDYVERLKQVKALLDSGIINQDDFEKMKQKIIDTMN